MERARNLMEKTGETLSTVFKWLARVQSVPLVFAEADQTTYLQTEPRPLLELVLVRQGRFTLHVGGRTAELRPGTVAWINAHLGNHADLTGSEARYACLSLDVGRVPAFRSLRRTPLLQLLQGPSLAWCEQAFGEVVRWHREPDGPMRHTLTRATLLRLLADLSSVEDDGGVGFRPRSIARALATLEQRSSDPELSLEDVARAAGVSSTTLRRQFLRHLQLSPVAYLQHVRLERARELLARTSLEVKEVAAQVGYADPLYFSKAFRQRFGVPPSRWAQRR